MITDYDLNNDSTDTSKWLSHINKLRGEDHLTEINGHNMYTVFFTESEGKGQVNVLELYPHTEPPFLFTNDSVDSKVLERVEQYTGLMFKMFTGRTTDFLE